MVSVKQKTNPTFTEFVILISLMMSLTALSIDAVLPALAQIGTELGVQNPNDRQLVITMIFLGLSIGQLFFGPLSDQTGRKPAIYIGLVGYMLGALLSAFSVNFTMMLFGRFLQGIGVSAPRAVTLALVRDQYEGRRMAQVMSFVMTIFILVPIIAPTLGQAILLFAGWRTIFSVYIILGLIVLIWFGLRQPETLAPENRVTLSVTRLWQMILVVVRNQASLWYTITAGLISGAFIGYLNSAQQIFQEQYALGDLFSIYFSIIAISLGLASFLNARLVMRFGMRTLVRTALYGISGLALLAFSYTYFINIQPALWLLMTYLMLTFFCVGILFGNLNSLAMEPLGKVAGIGSAIVGSLSTIISTIIGAIIGQQYNGTILPLIIGLFLMAAASIFTAHRADPDQP